MAIKTINDLIEATSASDNDYLLINQNGNARKIKVESLNINNGSSEFVDVSEYGAIGDGVTDDSVAFQNALNSGLNVTATQGKTYLITRPLSINKSNQIVDMKNAKIIMNHSTSIASKNDDLIALFTVDNNDSLENFVLGTAYPMSGITLSDGYITVSSTTGLSIGDFLRFNCHQGGTFQHDESALKPMLEIVAEVTNIDGKKVYLDYHTPNGGWSFDTASPSSMFATVSCNKIEMIKNIVLRNIYIEDITPYTEDLTKSMSAITCRCAHNVTVENIRLNNLLLNGVTFSYCHNFVCRNLKVTNARRGTGGKGYCLRMLANNKGRCDGIHGYLVRHIFDISAGAFIEVRNATGYCPNEVSGAFSLHGKFEHDLYLYNLSGIDSKGENPIMGFGSGKYFGNAVDNVFIYNSNIKPYTQDYSMYGRIYFENCDVCEYVTLPRVSYTGCNVYRSIHGYYPLNSARGTTTELYKKFVNCTINLPTNSNNYTYLQVVNSNITALNVSTTYALISNSTIQGLTINDTEKTANETTTNISIQGNLFMPKESEINYIDVTQEPTKLSANTYWSSSELNSLTVTSAAERLKYAYYDVKLPTDSSFAFSCNYIVTTGKCNVRIYDKDDNVLAQSGFSTGSTGSGEYNLSFTTKSDSEDYKVYFFVTDNTGPYEEEANVTFEEVKLIKVS